MNKLLVALLLLIPAALLIGAPAARAGTVLLIDVTSTADTPTSGTLRQAILVANAAVEDEVAINIDLAPGAKITLSGNLPTLSHPDVSLFSAAPDQPVIVDAESSYRILTHFGGTDSRLSLFGLELRRGDMNGTAQFTGGACLFSQGNVTLEKTTFRDCSAFNGSGAAVFAQNGLTVTDSDFIDNTVVQDGSAPVSRGGAVYCGGPICSISSSEFLGNSVVTQLMEQTQRGGGAVFATADEFSVVESSFIDNQGLGRGGALYLTLTETGASAQISHSLFRTNTGGEGGAIWVEGLENNQTLALDRNSFDRNTASGRAPALRTSLVAQIDLTGNVFSMQSSTNDTVAWGTVYIFANNTRQTQVNLDFNTFVGNDDNSILFQTAESAASDVVINRMHANIFDQRGSRGACDEDGSDLAPVTGSFNVVSDATCTVSIEGDSLINTDPMVNEARRSKRTIVYPAENSPAVDLVTSETLVVCSGQTDLDGSIRPLDGDDSGMAYCDAGAVERNVELFSDRFESS